MSANKAPKNHVFYRNQNWHYPKIEKGEGVYLFGEDGKRYLDACSGSAVANIGHGNKEIAEFAKQQIERIAFTHLSRWTVDVIEECASKVSEWAPGDLNHVYFVSGGSEATETAMKMARQYFIERDGKKSSKWKIISKWDSYHGNTLGALSMTGHPGRRKFYDPMLANFPKIPQFYHYRNPWGCKTLEETSIKAAKALEEEILKQGADNIAAFITEPVVGSAIPGVHPDKIYFQMVREICNKYDILLIVDEVMAGFGRTGEKFAVDHFDTVPDIIACAKGMSAGYTPMGATVCNDEIFETIMVKGSGNFVHGHTYASNPLSCGISLKVLEIIERENYLENAKAQGAYFMEKLEELYKYPIIGDVRGKGLMAGLEFVKDQSTKEPFEVSENVKGKFTVNCLAEGIVPYPGGGSADGVRGDDTLLAPPINITREEVDELLVGLEKAIAKTCDDVLGVKA
ncbi:aminotransferase family protein [Natronincola ferrireducens]|uniref:Adenosylmethionine-8-amino-7-oxononanoate aminotransferase n=1 Tax=Natronincola ferrireducens TaxID=393762 RepID=A0A1G8XEU2_9FIRM|nr:aminotransferase class III-fold pyridoxal phosphate-dependent enzyme [Natronincola ferrireducens]SDJ88834.1 Adenosylmethionine-8-amino-7-oxononanoate aminotransferase [Natronincola ferrireducens]